MDKLDGILHAYQRLLPAWRFSKGADWCEDFAIKRFLKKMETPDSSQARERAEACFRTYIEFDESLARFRGLDWYPRKWYRARQTAHEAVRNFRLAPVEFTNGSEVKPTRGLNSIESKLKRSAWHCTPENFGQWARTAYETAAIKRATRKRFAKAMKFDAGAIRGFHRESWKRYGGGLNAPFLCFQRMLARVTHVYEASRFTTVPKDNKVDRPIATEGVCNMLVQRQIGNGIRALLTEHFGVDLDTLAVQHRRMISNADKATIDLKNASDSVSCQLVEFLFPKRFVDALYACRAPYLEGPDGDYYVLRKVSSMGCGFTFELMSLILLCLGLEHDEDFSVFGDDIIVTNDAAPGLVKDLEAVGFAVNRDKSHIGGEFRESCGANWHDSYGYVRSFDFRYPKDIHDCIVLFNKARLLGESYPQFRRLSSALIRPVPLALQGPRDVTWEQVAPDGAPDRDKDILLSAYFKTGRSRGGLKVDDRAFSGVFKDLHLDRGSGTVRRYFTGFKWNPKLASKRSDALQMKHHYGKYAMYLHGGRRVDDSITGRGAWQPVTWVQVGLRAFRVSAIVSHSNSASNLTAVR